MKVIDVEIGKSEFAEEDSYKITLNGKYSTEQSNNSHEPIFQKNKFQILSNNFKEMKEILIVTIVGIKYGVETIKGSEQLELIYGKETTSFTVEFSKARGALVDGIVNLGYKLYKQSLSDTLRNNIGIRCLSINANYLNILVEKPFELKVLIKDHLGAVVATTKLNNRSSVFYLDMDMQFVDKPVEIVVSDAPGLYSIVVHPGRSLASMLQLSNGDPMTLTTQLVTGEKVVTGTVHSSALREASVSTTATGKRFSLSPRRPSVRGADLLGTTGVGEMSAKKSLLFLEDASSTEIASLDTILQGVRQTTTITAAESQSALSTERLLATSVGPSSGAYVTCSSKNEILLDTAADSVGGKKKASKKNKRQLHVVNLGLVPLHVSSLTSPVKLRAELLDGQPLGLGISVAGQSDNNTEKTENTVPKPIDADQDPENSTPPPNSVFEAPVTASIAHQMLSIAYSGQLEETSRELFNESGCIALVLEGKLFRKITPIVPVLPLGAAVATTAADGVSPRGVEETCMAVKVYLSLVPSGSATIYEEPSSNGKLSATTVSPRSAAVLESVSEKDIYAIDTEILDFGGYTLEKKNLPTATTAEVFNVVTSQSAQPDELSGSSVLSVPVQPLTKVAVEVSTQYGELSRAQSASQFGEKIDPKHILHLQQLQLEDQQRSRMIASNNAFAEIVRAELVEKQRTIEKLTMEVKERTEAIHIVGKDIRELRQEKANLLHKLESVEATLAQKMEAERATNQNTERMLKSSAALQDMDRDTLVRLLNQLRDTLNTSEAEKVELQTVLRGAKSTIDQFAVMKRDYKELQGAHMEQTRYLQKMQSKINKVDVYRGTIATQEGVIASMQNVIEAKIHKHRGLDKSLLLPRPPRRAHRVETVSAATERDDVVSRCTHEAVEQQLREATENASYLQERVRSLEEQLELAKYTSDSGEEGENNDGDTQLVEDEDEDEEEEEEKAINMMGDSAESRRKIDQLEAELVSKGFRISALEKQLETSTIEYSREIARLRTKLFELEINSSLLPLEGEGYGDEDGGSDMTDFVIDGIDGSNDNDKYETKQSATEFAPIISEIAVAEVPPVETEIVIPPPVSDSVQVVSPQTPTTEVESITAPVHNQENIPEHSDVAPAEEVQSRVATPPAPREIAVKPSVDRVIETTIDVLDAADSEKRKCANLSFTVRYVYDSATKISRFSFNRMEIHGFEQAENKTRFQPYLELHLGHMDWTLRTDTITDAGPKVTWSFDGDTHCLIMSEEQLERGAIVECSVKKVSVKAHADFLIGIGSLSLLY